MFGLCFHGLNLLVPTQAKRRPATSRISVSFTDGRDVRSVPWALSCCQTDPYK
jgi:hypothetical protein